MATEDGSQGRVGRIPDLVPEFMAGADQVFACGPEGMYRTLAALISGWAGKGAQVLLESPMACGFGGCYGCAVNTRHGFRLVCRDGPCFELGEIIWQDGSQEVRVHDGRYQ